MNCPRCTRAGAPSAYRGAGVAGVAIPLEPETHPFGPTIARCRSCRGAFAKHEALVAIENGARRAWSSWRKTSARDAARRAFDPPTAAIACPSCAGETTRREWSIGTMVFVDVCVECRGVWLDSGELEALGG